jgi:hypothetical protein
LLICGFKPETYIDPCWPEQVTADGLVKTVVCPAQPWDKRLIRIAVSHPFRYDAARLGGSVMHARHPWGIELMSGLRCVGTFHGTTSGFRGKYVSYGCPGTARAALYPFDRSPAVWQTHTVRLTRNLKHPFVGPRHGDIAVAYVARAEPPSSFAALPFTGPRLDVKALTLAALFSVTAGMALMRTSRAR